MSLHMLNVIDETNRQLVATRDRESKARLRVPADTPSAAPARKPFKTNGGWFNRFAHRPRVRFVH